MDITEHEDDMFCACSNCRERKGHTFVVAEPTELSITYFSKEGIMPAIDTKPFKTKRYQLHQKVSPDGAYCLYKYIEIR